MLAFNFAVAPNDLSTPFTAVVGDCDACSADPCFSGRESGSVNYSL
jgi:hypothetical protein